MNYAKRSSTGAIHFAVSGCFSGCCYQLLSKIRVHSSTASSFEMFGQAPGKKREFGRTWIQEFWNEILNEIWVDFAHFFKFFCIFIIFFYQFSVFGGFGSWIGGFQSWNSGRFWSFFTVFEQTSKIEMKSKTNQLFSNNFVSHSSSWVEQDDQRSVAFSSSSWQVLEKIITPNFFQAGDTEFEASVCKNLSNPAKIHIEAGKLMFGYFFESKKFTWWKI